MPAGKVTALIGPSGCGKSTFLRTLNRMHELIPGAEFAGQVMLDGLDIYDPSRRITDARRHIGMVFQKPNPFPAMSIEDNVLEPSVASATRGSVIGYVAHFLGSVSGTLPVSDLILVVHNKIDKGTGDSDVSLLPRSVLVLLELKNFETIEVDGVDGLFLPFLVEKGVGGPSEHAEAIRNSLDMKCKLEIFVL
jgi:ABC-type Fe3+/spermidine/putrescine transport system ATPase subunit